MLDFLEGLGRAFAPFQRPHLLAQQVYFAGVRSLAIILVSGLFVGIVLAVHH